MNYKTFFRKTKLDEKAFEEIKASVKEAESKTTGEIALAITAESSSYAFWELLSSVVLAFIFVMGLFPLSNQIYRCLDNFFWSVKPWYLAAFYLVLTVVLVGILYALFNIPAIDYLIIPSGAKNECVSNRAMRYFAESGVYRTKEHSGIFIFVSYFERQVRIIADEGISSKISQDLWNLIADEMVESLSYGDVKTAYINAVKKCGDLLAENFPPHEDNPDELTDGLIVLEADRWV